MICMKELQMENNGEYTMNFEYIEISPLQFLKAR